MADVLDGRHEKESQGHEGRDVDVRPIAIVAVISLVLTVAVFVLMWVILDHYGAREARRTPPNPLAVQYGRRLPPEPRLQPQPIRDIHELRAAESATLESYGWADRKAGRARIPIERAMEIIAATGIAAAVDASVTAPAPNEEEAAPE